MNEIGCILKQLRENKGISMDKMCDDLSKIYGMNLAKSTISKWENGKAEPSLAYARVLTKYFGVTLDYIIGILNEKETSNNNLSTKEENLLLSFNKLNDIGKNEANKRVDELTYINKYTKIEMCCSMIAEEQTDYLAPQAAHADFEPDDEEQQKLLQEDLDNL